MLLTQEHTEFLASKLDKEWKNMAASLGFNKQEIQTFIDGAKKNNKQQAFKMLDQWATRDDFSMDRKVQELTKGLEKLKRKDLLTDLRKREKLWLNLI